MRRLRCLRGKSQTFSLGARSPVHKQKQRSHHPRLRKVVPGKHRRTSSSNWQTRCLPDGMALRYPRNRVRWRTGRLNWLILVPSKLPVPRRCQLALRPIYLMRDDKVMRASTPGTEPFGCSRRSQVGPGSGCPGGKGYNSGGKLDPEEQILRAGGGARGRQTVSQNQIFR